MKSDSREVRACLKSMGWSVYVINIISYIVIKEYIYYLCVMKTIREIIFSKEFEEFYDNLDGRTQEKYDYAFDMIRTQYVINKNFVKSLENTDFYELRISIGHNEYRSIMLAIDHDNFIQAHRVLVLNSFLKKGSKQYKAEVRTAESILMKYYMEE